MNLLYQISGLSEDVLKQFHPRERALIQAVVEAAEIMRVTQSMHTKYCKREECPCANQQKSWLERWASDGKA